jgi:hypothetical protein
MQMETARIDSVVSPLTMNQVKLLFLQQCGQSFEIIMPEVLSHDQGQSGKQVGQSEPVELVCGNKGVFSLEDHHLDAERLHVFARLTFSRRVLETKIRDLVIASGSGKKMIASESLAGDEWVGDPFIQYKNFHALASANPEMSRAVPLSKDILPFPSSARESGNAALAEHGAV